MNHDAQPSILTDLIRVSRPRFWMYTFGPFVIGCVAGLPLYEDRSKALIEVAIAVTWLIKSLAVPGVRMIGAIWIILTCVFLSYFLLPANALLYGVNDYFDHDIDSQNPKKHGYEARIPKHRFKKLFIITSILQLPYFALLSWLMTAVDTVILRNIAAIAASSILFVVLAVTYSAPPLRFKARPFFDSTSNILYMLPGIVGYGFTTIFSNTPISSHIILPCLAGALWCMAMHAVSAVPDIASDSSAGIQTIATKLGATKTLIACALAYLVSAALLLTLNSLPLAVFGVVSCVVYLGILVWMHNAQDKLTVYKYYPYINALVGMALFFAVLYR